MGKYNNDNDFIGKSSEALISTLQYRDEYTFLHSDRVVLLAQELGKRLGLNKPQLHQLWIASIFHDIGKIGIPDAILNKPGKLNEKEWSVMKTHSAISGDIIDKIDMPDAPDLANIVRHHHEFYDGSGYPDGLSGDDIPYLARIISLVDCYDAMTSDREYREGMSHTEAIAIMAGETGSKFDPELAEAFFGVIEGSEFREGFKGTV